MSRSNRSWTRPLRAAALAAGVFGVLGALGAGPVWADESTDYLITSFKDTHVVLYAAQDDTTLCEVPTDSLVARLTNGGSQRPCELNGASAVAAKPTAKRLRRKDRKPINVEATREGDKLVFAIGADEVAVAAAAVQYQPAAALSLPHCTKIAGEGQHASVRGSGAEDPRCR